MPNGAHGAEPSPYVELDRAAWAKLGGALRPAPLRRRDHQAARTRRPARSRRGPAGLPAPLPAAQPPGEGGPPAAPQAGGVPAAAAAAAHAVRHRAGRLGGGRQVDHGPRPAAPPRALARAPERRAGDHRRLPLPERRAPATRTARAQGLPRVLRPEGPAAVRGGHQVGQGRGRGPDVLPPRVRRGARRARRDHAPRHRHRRGPQRPPAGAAHRRRTGGGPRAERLLRLHASTSTPRRPTSVSGTSNGSCGCARPPSRDPASYFSRYARLSAAEATATAQQIWDDINGPNLRQNIQPTRSRATLVLRKDRDHSVRYVRLRKL